MRIPIAHPSHFNFPEILRFLSRSTRECLHYVEDGHLFKMIAVQEVPLLMDIRYKEGAAYLDVDVIKPDPVPMEWAAPALAAAAAPVQALLTRWLHLDADLRPFYTFAATDPVLAPLVRDYHGLRLVGVPDLFESITWTVMGQQINLAFAYTTRKRFIETLGYSVEHGGRTHYLYPKPAVVAAAQPELLREMQFSRGKITYMQNLAQQIVQGQFSAALVDDAPDFETAKAALVALKGIGNWSANYVLMKYARYPQSLPLEDAGLHQALRRYHHLPGKPALDEVKRLTAHWGPHAAYATFYCWHSLFEV
ncbi:DNA-3-methyladenine glycosylase [Chitinophaga parva]|uniref:DNA-3-methyladenine glycosylase II n=1 Tax=Chitinophaga parva TaxID=2169414 RepID=A0A2T7BGS0_9BACT|nr:DNA-3-methyladenine glycosylase [Chitinophaga parva]PUZ25477.1 DNA-3-methyladenine glycosylase [Chitinophaga parva]